jgi:AcrR family transcriptional regulator
MKKGELRRLGILDTAEKLFFERGYEETSVQDILDAMGLSKGGFYHHFDSKMAVLNAVSVRRAEQRYSVALREIRASSLGAVEKLNRLLSLLNLFEREAPAFVSMVLNVCYRGGNTAMLDSMKAVTLEKLAPVLDEIIAQGMRDGVLYTRQPGGIARLILMLAHDINDEAARMLVDGLGKPECVVALIDVMNVYRDTVELILNAPHGSVRLFDIDRVLKVCRAVLSDFEPEMGSEE